MKKRIKIIILISIVLVIIIIGLIIGVNILRSNLANENYNSANSNSNNGSLIASNIKAGITIGGVTGTLKDIDTSDATATAEDILEGKTAYVDGKKITGTMKETVTLESLNIGDYIDYTPDYLSSYQILAEYSGYERDQTLVYDDTLKWRIMSINDDGTVEIISDKPSSQYSPILRGAVGYNNSVYILNDICKNMCSNKSLGAIGRSINMEDIEKGYNASGKEFMNNYISDDGIKYGQTKTYDLNNSYYPNLYSRENGAGINTSQVINNGIKRSEEYYKSLTEELYFQATDKGLTVTQTYYEIPSESSYYNNNTFWSMINNGRYFIASRCQETFKNNPLAKEYTFFGLFGTKRYNSLFLSNSEQAEARSYIRPVVTLSSNIKITGGEGNSVSPYTISK